MMPGKFNPRQMNQMMKKLGINVKDIDDVEQVFIITSSKKYVFDEPEVTVMDAQGQRTYQVVGRPRVVSRSDNEPKEESIPQGDIDLVVEQTGKSAEEAKKALEETNGDIAEAILKLSS